MAEHDRQINLENWLLYLLAEKGAMSPWELLKHQDETLKEFYEALEGLKAKKFVAVDKKVSLTPSGQTHLATLTGEKFTPLHLQCKHCECKGYDIQSDHELLKKFATIIEKRPPPREEYDQTAISAEDALIRIGFFHDRGDLVQKSILMIGDFDCLSIVCALTNLPTRVVVFEVDEGLVAFINNTAKEYDLRLEAHVWDVRGPLPEEYCGAFDVFSADPVETVEGIKLYISRGTQGLRGIGSAAYIGLTTQEASKKKWRDIQQLLYQMNFVLTDVNRNFNYYPLTGHEDKYIISEKLGSPPDTVFYSSALLRCEAVDTPNPLVTGPYEGTDDIYFDDEAWGTDDGVNSEYYKKQQQS